MYKYNVLFYLNFLKIFIMLYKHLKFYFYTNNLSEYYVHNTIFFLKKETVLLFCKDLVLNKRILLL